MRPSRTIRSVAYLATTTLVVLAFLSGGVAYLSRAGPPLQGLADLGYPPYFVTLLGIWKVLGALALAAPAAPRLKEWAYAGIAFDLTGAAFSHAAVGDPAVKVMAPLAILGIAVVSWALRPPARMLRAAVRTEGAPGARAPRAVARGEEA